MKPWGLGLIVLACLVPLIWLPGIATGRDGIALFSQYLGLVALIVMAFAQIIATRWVGIEAVFGPMDQSYRLHKWLGLTAMATILLHDTIDAEMDGLGRETTLVEIAETLGEISLYGLLILVVLTVATFVPYHLWKWTHRFIGVFFVFGALHYIFILKPFANGDPLGLYMLAILALGTVAYAYTSAPRVVRPSRRYAIVETVQEGNALAVEMVPEAAAMRHRAGQFAFFSFTGAGLNEPHPFTISSAPREDGGLRITVAPLGDLTRRVTEALRAGQAVRVEGPFGHFGRGVAGPQVWIGAGVGITPFLAMAEALASDAPAVTLIYAVRGRSEAPHLAALEALAAAKPNLRLVVWESAQSGRLTPDAVVETVGPGLASGSVLFCGPTEMRDTLREGLARQGVSDRDFHFEAFEIRTGIGLESMARWLRSKVV